MHRPRQHGFTLIELMVVMVVAGILMMVAVPSYQSAMQKSRRTDARVAFTQTTQRLERCYTQYGTYNSPNCAIASPFNSPDSYYQLTLVRDATTYTLTAVPQGTQTHDTACGTLAVNNAGQHTASGSTPEKCW